MQIEPYLNYNFFAIKRFDETFFNSEFRMLHFKRV